MGQKFMFGKSDFDGAFEWFSQMEKYLIAHLRIGDQYEFTHNSRKPEMGEKVFRCFRCELKSGGEKENNQIKFWWLINFTQWSFLKDGGNYILCAHFSSSKSNLLFITWERKLRGRGKMSAVEAEMSVDEWCWWTLWKAFNFWFLLPGWVLFCHQLIFYTKITFLNAIFVY